jgi:hypothetical protein
VRASRLAVSFLVVASSALATPAERSGFGARSAALSAADGADGLDYSAVYQNPASLTVPEGSLIGAGYQAYDYSLDAGAPDSVQLIEGGFVARGAFFSLPVGIGVAFALPDGKLSSFESLDTRRPAWVIDELSNRVAFIGAGAALEPFEGLTLGATLGHLAAVEGSFSVEGSAAAAFGGEAPSSSALTHSVDAELRSVRYGIFGARLRPSRWLALALIYRDEARIEQRIGGVLDGELDYGPLAVPVTYEFESRGVSAYLPRRLTLALHLAPDVHTAIDASLALEDLSELPSPEARTSSRARAEVPPGVSLDLPPDRHASPASAAGFRDRFVPRLGVERRFRVSGTVRLAGRAGFSYEATTLEGDAPWLDADRWNLSLGGGLEKGWPSVGRLRLDYYALFSQFGGGRGHATGTGCSLSVTFR